MCYLRRSSVARRRVVPGVNEVETVARVRGLRHSKQLLFLCEGAARGLLFAVRRAVGVLHVDLDFYLA